jgi:hypothetical protein
MLNIYKEDGGYSTIAMLVALMLTLSLLFSTAQVYRLNSASASIQEVADVSALAAENTVAQFVTCSQVCDAVLLTCTLTGYGCAALSVVAFCIPGGASVGKSLLSAGRAVIKTRNTFAQNAVKLLNVYQEALPFLAAVNAYAIAEENNKTVSGSSYKALAILCPFTAEEISIDLEDSSEVFDEIEESEDELSDAAEKANEALLQAEAIKNEAYMADCGNNPSSCAYERAASLANLSSSKNPLYRSVETWSYSVALKRAKAYYSKRLSMEPVQCSSVKDRAQAELRKNYYQYMCSVLSGAYVIETDGEFSAYFPKAPQNKDEWKQTSLYTEKLFPVSTSSGSDVAHAWSGCPNATSATYYCSLYDMEQNDYSVCEFCQFKASNFTQIASLTSKVSSGFEYHYNIIADTVDEYESLQNECLELEAEVKETSTSFFEDCIDAIKASMNVRIEIDPPGKYGAVAIVTDTGKLSSNAKFASRFVDESVYSNTRLAVSGATLIEDTSDENASVLTGLLDGIYAGNNSTLGIDGLVLSFWSTLIKANTDMQNGISGAISSALDALPVIGKTSLSNWVENKLEDLFSDLGISPAYLGIVKPVLVNSASVAQKDTSGFLSGFYSFQQGAIVAQGISSAAMTQNISSLEQKLDGLAFDSNFELEIAEINLFGEYGPSIPVCITLPSIDVASPSFAGMISEFIGSVCTVGTEEEVWR